MHFINKKYWSPFVDQILPWNDNNNKYARLYCCGAKHPTIKCLFIHS